MLTREDCDTPAIKQSFIALLEYLETGAFATTTLTPEPTHLALDLLARWLKERHSPLYVDDRYITDLSGACALFTGWMAGKTVLDGRTKTLLDVVH